MKKRISFLEKNFLIFLVYAFLGWIYEVLWFIIVRHKFVNRGFLFGPYLPIYGFGALLLYYLLKNFMKKKHKIGKVNLNVVLVFIIVFLVTTIVEYVAHYILDNYFGIILWDYSKDYLNINGRVCFAASRNFAIGGTFALYCVQPFLDKLITKVSGKTLYHIIITILFIVVMSDLIITLVS